MKSFIFVAASAAYFARASALLDGLDAGAGLDLNNDGAELKTGLGVDKALDASADLKITLPHGVELPDLHKPTGPPGEGLRNTWHPPHPGVIIDGCDDEGNDEWHYVHPCEDCTKTAAPHVWTTSTVSAVPVTTVISCGVSGSSCPDGQKTGSATVAISVALTTPTILPIQLIGDPDESQVPTAVGDMILDTTTVAVPAATSQPADPEDPEDPKTTAAAKTSSSSSSSPSSAATTASRSSAAAVPSQGFSTYTVGSGPQPSSGPAFPIPANSTAPTYSPPGSKQPSNCVGEGCRPVYQPPAPAAPGVAPSGTGAGSSSFPTIPAVAGASRQSISIALFAGTAAAFACLL